MASYLSAITPVVANQTSVFAWDITCRTILSEIKSHPVKDPVRFPFPGFIQFPPNMHKIEFDLSWQTPNSLDVLARIAFQLVPFLSSECQRWHYMYLANRKNVGAVRHAVEGCETHTLAETFGRSLRFSGVDSASPVIHAITVVANCVQHDSKSIEFIEEVFKAAGGPDQIPQNSTIWVTRHLRHLGELETNLCRISQDVDSFNNFAQLQEICQDDLLRPRCPLFLPEDVDVRMVIQSLRAQLFNWYLLTLSDFLNDHFTPGPARRAIPVFKHQILKNEFRWDRVDPEIQHICFKAIVTHSNLILSHANLTSQAPFDFLRTELAIDSSDIGEQLWSSALFWTNIWEGTPNLAGIELPCLRLLLESLKSYHIAAEKPQDGVSLDTKHSKKLLVAVEQQLAVEEDSVTPYAPGGSDIDTENIDTTSAGEVQREVQTEGNSQ
ncbi:hypothetical protein K438DRAFT_1834844 [Mycena galopus ATCC 62051]|nr:hypothetical protein K438DRAFT_1834844 [Mycena galopus ATCC 62051]